MKPFLAWISLLCACTPAADAPDGGTAPDADLTPLGLVDHEPADDATDVATEAMITARFDRDVDAATFAVTLVDDLGAEVQGTAAVSGDVGTFTPTAPLRAERTYTATLGDVTDLEGRALDAEVTWSFSTRSRAWASPALVESDDAGGINQPAIAVDPAGNAIALWYQADATHERAVANRFVVGEGWSTAAPVDTEPGWDRQPQVAVDPSGDAIAIWRHQDEASVTTLRTSRFVAGQGWSAAETLEPGEAPQLAADAAGNSIAVWTAWINGAESIRAARYAAGVGWDAPIFLETDDTGDAGAPQIAIAADGDAIAAWVQYVNPYSVFASRYTAGVGWSAPERVELDDASEAWEPQLAVDAAGNAVAVWELYENAGVAASRYTAAGGWGPMVTLATSGRAPLVAMAPTGEAIVTWSHADGTGVETRRYVPADGWGAAEPLTSTGGCAGLALDRTGGAVALLTGTTGLAARRFAPDTGWAPPNVLYDGVAYDARLAINPAGDAVALWGQAVGARVDLWSSALR